MITAPGRLIAPAEPQPLKGSDFQDYQTNWLIHENRETER
jgi:hypothetical protein